MNSLFLGKIIGLFFIIISVAHFINFKNCKKITHNIIHNLGLIALIGCLNTIFGLIIISYHNFWNNYFQITISIIGWLFLFWGLFIIFFPKAIVHIGKKSHKTSLHIVVNLILLLIGVLLTYESFL